MTRNQNDYIRNLETQRANRMQESIRLRELGQELDLATMQQAEVRRHNIASETEVGRHNQAVESLDSQSLGETRRSNMARENYQSSQLELSRLELNERIRSNLASESELQRSHTAQEAETARANMAREQETQRHNIYDEYLQAQSLSETQRRNLAQEDISRREIAESARYHDLNVGLGYSQLQEQSRYNDIRADLERSQINETTRSNIAREDETRRHNVITETENRRSNLADEIERNRSNLMREGIDADRLAEQIRSDKASEVLKGLDILEHAVGRIAQGLINKATELGAIFGLG